MQLAFSSAVRVRSRVRTDEALGFGTPRLHTVLTCLAIAGALVFIIAFVAAAVFRLTYPFPLEVIEAAARAQVDRILAGQPLYVQPTLEYVPLIYGPVYFYLAAPVAALGGAPYLSLRLISLLASCGSLFVVFGLVRRETGSLLSGVLAAGVLAACNPLVENNMDLGRVDALFTFLVLAAIWLARSGIDATDARARTNWKILAASGAVLGAAACTKVPIAAVPVGGALCLYLLATRREQVIPFVAGLCATVGVVVLLLRVQSGPWATWYMLDLPRQHGFGRDLVGRFWIADTLPRFTLPLVVLGPLFMLGRVLRGDRSTPLFYGLVSVSLLATAWASRTNGGGAPNVLLPAYAMIALLFGFGFDQLLREIGASTQRARAFQALVLGTAVVQFALVAYNPRFGVPNRTELLADQRQAQALSALPGPVLAPDMGGYLRSSGASVQPHLGAVDELLGGYGGNMTAEGDEWQATLDHDLGQKRFRSIVLQQSDCCLKGSVRAYGYADSGPLIPSGEDFYFWRAPWTPQLELYVLPT